MTEVTCPYCGAEMELTEGYGWVWRAAYSCPECYATSPMGKDFAQQDARGRAYGCRCRDCPHLHTVELRSGRRYFKCEAYGESSASSTDWAQRWEACGLFGRELEYGHIPLLDRIKHQSRPDNTPIVGQLDMFGGCYEGMPDGEE